jgi:hypothetical protein
VGRPVGSRFLNSPGNFSADAFNRGTTNAFLVNASGLGSLSEGLGVYALVTSADPERTVKVASFPANAGGSGFTAVSDNGVAALGYSDASYTNKLHAVPPVLMESTIGSGTPLTLTDQPEVAVGSNFTGLSPFGNGVAVLRGGFTSSTDVSRFAFSFGIAGPQSVVVEERVPVLTFVNQCTSVELLAPLGADLLVGLNDRGGRRLVRIRQTP